MALERHNTTLLEVTKKITELLTGEIPIRSQDVTVYFSMEEWEYLEGHKDLYRDVMMEYEPPLTPTDEFSNRNPPKRCPHPLYSQDSTQEDHTIPQHDQVQVKVEEEEQCVRGLKTTEDAEIKVEINQDKLLKVSTGGHYEKNTTEERLLLSSDYNVEVNDITQCSLGFNLIIANRDHKPYRVKKSIDPLNPGKPCDKSHTVTSDIYQRSQSLERPNNPSNIEESSPKEDQPFASSLSCLKYGKTFTISSKPLIQSRAHGNVAISCSELDKGSTKKNDHIIHWKSQFSHTHEGSCSCFECFNSRYEKGDPLHQVNPTTDHPYSRSECGKCFTEEEKLLLHQNIHTGKHLFQCSDCGKCFSIKKNLENHQRTHTGLYPCSECWKSFTQKGELLRHQRTHTGERPHLCSECGKRFTQKGELFRHQRIHTGEKPYSCPECWKCFTQKGHLLTHQRTHTGERPYACSECGRCFSVKGSLQRHQRSHAFERLCASSGLGIIRRGAVIGHEEEDHTGKSPYSCAECGKKFSKRGNLLRHEITHTSERPHYLPDKDKL